MYWIIVSYGRQSVYEIGCNLKGMVPKFNCRWHMG